MNQITKENINEFCSNYEFLHDAFITNINYDIFKSEIEILLTNVFIVENGKYLKMRLAFKGVEQCNNKEIFSWDYITQAFIKYIKIKNKEYICFANDDEDPFVYIACDSIEYEVIETYEK